MLNMKFTLSILWVFVVATASLADAAVPAGTDYSLINKEEDREKAYRQRAFRAYLPQEIVRARLRTNNYSQFENPTGIYYSAGESVVVYVEGEAPDDLALIIHNFAREGGHSEFPLRSGKNVFVTPHAGLAYVHYRSETPEKAPALNLRFEGGYVNGVFTQHDDAATWQRLLAHAKGNILDILGERVQLAYNVDGLLQYCPNQGPELLAIYDGVIRKQQELLGWEKYDCHPGNHIHGRVQWSGFMHADQIGAAFVNTAMHEVANVESLRKSAWAIAHEFGHINQCRPGMMWGGTQEVTVNIFAAWCCYNINPQYCRLTHEVTPVAGSLFSMRGGRMDSYVNSAIVRRQLWQFMTGPDYGLNTIPGKRTGDHFVSVSPLWQLQLYVAEARGMQDFYPQIFQQARSDAADTPHGQLRVLFCIRAADAAQLDLSEFFVKTGILAPMNRMVEDYQSHHVTITHEMCRAAIAHMQQYPKPDSSVIYYINANNVHIFRDRLPVIPSPDFDAEAVVGSLIIPANQWQNAVAFECYDASGKLLRVALRGFNNTDNASTHLIIPHNTATIRAVQWDGTRFSVWEK